MSLTTRVSLFFLAALGIILCLYSLAFYSVTRKHIDSQFAGELRGVRNSLVAAVEVEETEVKWQPLEHAVNIGAPDEFGEVQWLVIGDRDLIVERSRSVDDKFLTQIGLDALLLDIRSSENVTLEREGWVLIGQQLSAPRPEHFQRELDEFDRLTILVARSTRPRDAILFRLTLLVTLLPLLAWTIAAFLGHWMVRRALRPVADMADQAQYISGTDFHSRLSHGDSGDELTELGTAFNRLLDRQQIAFEQQRRFAGDAAHELRTPLTVLIGQIDVILRRPRTESEYRTNLEFLRKQTQALYEIVESLLFLARRDAETETPSLRRMEVKPWLEEQLETWEIDPRYGDLQLKFDLSERIEVRATPALLGRVVNNLINNAIKYSDAGTAVIVTARETDDQMIVQVSDSGPGIEPEEISKLFQPFFRSREARRRGIAGTGLGLAIASRIAETLGGCLQCHSELGRGSCFELYLPLVCKIHR